MARRHCVAVATAALLVASLTACDSTGGGNNPPTTSATASFPSDGVHGPVIPDPIEPRVFIKEPCTSLTPEQQKKFNLDSGKAGSMVGGIKCVYQYTSSDRWIQIAYTTNQEGLQSPAQVRLPPEVRWVPEILDNYPAIAEYKVDSSVSGDPPSCYYMVGLKDDVYFAVLVQSADGGQECTVARQVATDVLSNIKKHR